MASHHEEAFEAAMTQARAMMVTNEDYAFKTDENRQVFIKNLANEVCEDHGVTDYEDYAISQLLLYSRELGFQVSGEIDETTANLLAE